MPSNIQQPLRRRGAVSAEPINEEDAATYVKKVKTTKWKLFISKVIRYIFYPFFSIFCLKVMIP